MVTGNAGCACSARRCIASVIPSRKNASRLRLPDVPRRRSDQLLGLGHGKRGEEVGKDRPHRAAQPDVEEVRQVRVSDIVVVGRVGGVAFCASICFVSPRPTDPQIRFHLPVAR